MARDDHENDDLLAVAGWCRLSRENLALVESIERRIALGIDVPTHEFEAVLFAVYASAFGDFHVAKEPAA